jgi:predicted nucleotidyltransferase
MKPYNQIIEQVVANLREEFGLDLLGVLLTGSLAYGIPRLHSDIDLFIIIRPSWRQVGGEEVL